MHLKRSKTQKFWAVPRKGTKYLSVPSHNQNESVPLAVVMRDILKVVKSKKELKSLLMDKKVMINKKNIHETNFPVSLFDTISLPDMKKNYRAVLSENKKIVFEEISEKESETKIYKVLNKKMLAGKNIQINLMHGRNILTKEKADTGDSVIVNLKDGKIVKVIKMEKGKNAFVTQGKHAGLSGKIEEVVERGGKKIAKMTSGKERINVWIKNIIVME